MTTPRGATPAQQPGSACNCVCRRACGHHLHAGRNAQAADTRAHTELRSSWLHVLRLLVRRYKVPTPDLLPGRFVVSFLDAAPNRRGVLSSKASGEPSLMASTSVLLALQRAAAEAAAEVEALCCGAPGAATPWRVLAAPATPPRLRAVVGVFSIADALQAALVGGDS